MTPATLLKLAKTHGTPLFVVDHAELRRNYATFRKHFPRVQVYYAVKVNSDPAIVETFYKAGGSFDVASMQEFHTVHQFIEHLPKKARQDFIWDKIIYANPIKPTETLRELDQYRPLVTYDNHEEVKKIAKHAPHAGLALRMRVPNTGSMVELSSKFGALPGEAVELIEYAHKHDLVVEGLSFHVGSQCTNPQNYIQALHLCASVFAEAKSRGFELKLLDIGGGFPAAYDDSVPEFSTLAKSINHELDRLFPASVEILAEPGRFLVASAGWAVSKIIGKAFRNDKTCYYVDDGVYHTYSGVIFDHCTYHMKTPSTRSASQSSSPISRSATISTAKRSAPTPPRQVPTSTASRRRRWFTSTRSDRLEVTVRGVSHPRLPSPVPTPRDGRPR
jgi:ornithine decarboxylase